MTLSSELIILATRIVYRFPNLSKQQKLNWSNSLRGWAPELSESELQLYESQGASQPISASQTLSQIERLTSDQKVSLAGLLKAFTNQILKVGAENEAGILKVIEPIEIQLSEEEKKLAIERTQLLNQGLTRYTNRPLLKIPARIWPLIFDFGVRCFLLMLLAKEIVSDKTVLVLNVFLPLLIMLVTYWAGNKDRRFNSTLLGAIGGVNGFKITYQIASYQYTILVTMLAMGAYFSYILAPGFYGAAFLLALYYFIYLRFFCLGRLTQHSLNEQIRKSTEERVALDADQNDEAIVKLETRLNSITSRLEAYVLESALFGALSFSGFLQIMSDNQVSFSILERFASQIYNATEGLVKGNDALLQTSISSLNSKENLFCLLSVETLLCSIFFLGVIASRLRFSDIADRVRLSLNLSKAFNQKEEMLVEKKELASNPRFIEINSKVNQHLHQGEDAMSAVAPVMDLMQYLRNAGLLTFLLILISSSFFITSAMAMGFFALSLMAWAYFNRKFIQWNLQFYILALRTNLIRYQWHIIVLSGLMIGSGLLLRIHFQVDSTDELVSFGIITLAFFIFTWIVLYPQVDKRFGNIESGANQWNDRRWLLIKIPVAILTATNVLGIFMKINHMAGANEFLLIGFAGIALLTFFLSFYLSRPKWLGLIPSFAISTNLMGTLFKTLHLAGADEMVRIGMFGAIVSIPIFIFLRKRFHKLFFFFSIWFMVINVLLLTGVLERTGLRYGHKTWHVSKIVTARDRSFYWRWIESDADRISEFRLMLSDSRWYLKEFGHLGFGAVLQEFVRSFEFMAQYAWQQHEAGNDNLLPLAAESSAQLREIFIHKGQLTYKTFSDDEILNMLKTESKILLALGRKDEAHEALEGMMRTNPPEPLRQGIEKLKMEFAL